MPCDGSIRKAQAMVMVGVSRQASSQPGLQQVRLQPTIGGKCCHCKDWCSRRHGVWTGYKGTYRLPVRKASQAPSHVMAASERHRQWSWVEYPNLASSESDSSPPLVGSAPCHLVVYITGRGSGMRNALPPCIWTCQFSNLQIQMWM